MKLSEPTCPLGYTLTDLRKILTDNQIIKFCEATTHATCDGRLAKAERKSKLQYYATVCADYPHGWIWSQRDILQFLEDEGVS